MKKSKYLLDTNICISLLRGNRDVAQKLIGIGEDKCFLSVITLYELMFGAYNSGRSQQEILKVKEFVNRFPVVSLMGSAEEYAFRKTQLRASGIMIDEFDLLIAATALSGNYILVTDNIKHFQRITNLRLENWIKR
ncbi:PIN domain-containing protein [Parabacteroides sp.]